MDEIRILSNLEEVKALSDPFRFRILNCFYEMKEPATVKQIADRLGEVPAKIHYHIKKLEKYDILRLHHTKEINGIIAKYYLPTAERFDINCAEDLGDSSKKLMLGETQRMLADLYDNNKQTFLSQVQKDSERKDGTKGYGTISAGNIYLTESQAKEFTQYIESYFKQHKDNDDEEVKRKYHCFYTIIRTE